MRWIDISGHSPKPDWLAKAQAVTNMLLAAKTKEERYQIIDENSKLWRDLKDELLELSKGKCWYSEAKQTVSFFDVDHFRPKNNVKKFQCDFETCNNSSGYWWLAFDWKNYRVAGEVSNRKKQDEGGVCRGKQDYFPLLDGSPIAQRPGDDLETETYYLLDPTCYEDVCLIAFDETGKPYPTAEKDSFEYHRARVTGFLLHLDFPPLVDQRIIIWNRCKRLINSYAYIMKNRDTSSPIVRRQISSIFSELREMVSEKAEFSSTAKGCLQQSEFEWARRIVSA